MTTLANEIVAYPSVDDLFFSSSQTGFVFDGVDEGFAVIFHIPATGTIDKVHYYVSGRSSPVLTLRIELRTVDTTTGLPNAAGTLYGSSTSITVTNPPSTGFKTAAVNCTGATAGDLVALVFDLSACTSGSVTLMQQVGGAPAGNTRSFPYWASTTTTPPFVKARLAVNSIALEYASATFHRMEWSTLTGNLASTAVANSGVIRAGNIIQSPVARRAVGVYCWGDLDGACYVRLRLASDDSLLATATVDPDVRGFASVMNHWLFFDSRATVNMLANTDYYVLLEGNSATASTLYGLDVPTSTQAMLNQISGGSACYGTSYTSPTYTDVTTRRYGIGILYDAFNVMDVNVAQVNGTSVTGDGGVGTEWGPGGSNTATVDANVVQVNGVTVTGDGGTGTEWGPA